MSERLLPVREEELSEAQIAARTSVIEGPRGRFGGPFVPMLHSPGLTDSVQKVGEYLRWGSALPGNLRELAILIVVRRWEQPEEWASHVHAGLAEGLQEDVILAVAAGQRPAESGPHRAVYDFCSQLLDSHFVQDDVYQRLRTEIGETNLVDVVGICGYYVTMAAVLNVARSVERPRQENFRV